MSLYNSKADSSKIDNRRHVSCDLFDLCGDQALTLGRPTEEGGGGGGDEESK